MNFSDTSPLLARALAERQYSDPTPVQSAVLADAALNRDLVVSARTGSGKTVAYGLAFAPDILDTEGKMPAPAAPLALVIAPTRELALQVKRELEWLYAFAGAHIVACVGGMDPGLERKMLGRGAQIVVGTPGRLRDHIERRALDCSNLAALVLDEADEMLDLGFREDIEFILDATPAERRTLLFSATIPKGIAALAKRYQRDALRVEVAGGERGHSDIEYRAVRVLPREIEQATINLLRQAEAECAIVFCNTRESVRHLHATLQERGFSCVLLSGELSQHERNQSMQALRDGRARVCVATDVAARGIDLNNVGIVIHAELPHDSETLQHRSGRTGRAGRKGVSALLVPMARRGKAEAMLRDVGARAEWSGPPTADEIRKLDQERMLKDPLLAAEPEERDIELGRLLLAERSPEQLGAALVRLYRSRLPAPEDIADPGTGFSRDPRPRDTRDSRPQKFREGPFKDDRGPRPAFEDRGAQKPRKPGKERFPGNAVWFRLDIGRRKNADPKWLLPMLCRKGEIDKGDIGVINIMDTETRVEISQAVAERFALNIKRPGGENIRVERVNGDPKKAAPPAANGDAAPKKKPKQKYISKAEREAAK